MSLFPLDHVLRRLIRHGSLDVVDPDGETHSFGTKGAEPHVKVRIADTRTKWDMVLRAQATAGDAYTSGRLKIEHGTLRDFLEIALVSIEMAAPRGAAAEIVRKAREIYHTGEVVNPLSRARRNIQHHYDLQESFYRLFLDKDMQYSCAYFRDETATLDEAQLAKKRHIAKKLLLKPDMEVLDIGSGWGGMAIFLAQEYGVRVTGVTLSDDQFAVSKRRAEEAGVADRVTFKLLDYRNEPNTFDRIVSVGMFEHVGKPQYRQFFRHLDRLLRDDGVALLHTIGRMDPPEPISTWIRRYIFPGAYLPSLSQLAPVIEKQGLVLADLENWRLHYAKTLRHWSRRVQEHRDEIVRMVDAKVFGSRFFGDPTTGEAFCRGWQFYLQACEAGFRYQHLCVFQLQLAKRLATVPLSRDYLYLEQTPVNA